MLKELREKRTKLVAQMRGMIEAAEAEDRDFTAEETTSYDALKAELDGLDRRIERLANTEAAETAGAQVVPAAARRQGVVQPQGPSASKEFENLGQFMSAVRFNPNDPRLNFVEGVGASGENGEIAAELRMDNDTQGGFMIPPQFRSTIMSVPPQDALVRPRAQVIPAGSPPDAGITMPALDQTGANPGNMFGGMNFQWIGEGDEKPETDAKLREFTLTPKEIAGTVTVTDKLLRNWQAASPFIENLMRQGVTAAEDYAFLRGSGVAQPLGALNSVATKFINRTNANTVTYADLVEMVARLLMRGGTQPVWSMPQSALPKLATMVDPEGHYIWKANAVDGFAGTLLGYPVRWNNRAPAIGSKGDILLADWSYYVIKDGSGPFVAASEHVLFRQNKTVIKIFWNVDGAPWLTAPIKEENGYEVSPFVGLDVPA
ncbi:phage major capsid protein [Phenylobacterium sp. J426]|uniref:phage major capsid protein n=1 Tax=Phenylobacterium sp. J426 TaxID=2898439 RepID=UPI00215097BB|nr:phage major capsid protein [Phenylobacterium sp. J426]MCR5874372.1 phage major capsid protein [Phenylobacterium sp. J426]